MLIAIQYRNGKFDMVSTGSLNRLLANQEIALFRRASGWVVVDRDDTRERAAFYSRYQGPERRTASH